MRGARPTLALVLALACAAAACDAASSETGYDALFQVTNAQFRPGPFPGPTGGPAAVMVSPAIAIAEVGRVTNNTLRGSLELGARGAFFGVAGIDGTWIVPASPPDVDTPGLVIARVSFALAEDFPLGPFTVQMAAVSDDGIGEAVTTDLVAVAEPPVQGPLIVELEWEGAADLDLHLTDPLGGEAWSDEPNTHKPPGPGAPPEGPYEYLHGAILDHDANADCHREGRPRERMRWPTMAETDRFVPLGFAYTPPPTGTWTVRVDARSLCGDPAVAWTARAYRRVGDNPQSLAVFGSAQGVATQTDVELPHGRGAGVLAFRFAL